MSAAGEAKFAIMSKKAQRFEQSGGWTSRAGGGARKGASSKPNRIDVSAGSSRMADGGGPGRSDILKKERLLADFRMWRADGKLGARVRCPICQQPVSADSFDRHVRRVH